MERAQTLPAAPHPLQLYVFADDRDDVRRLSHPGHVFVVDAHSVRLRRVRDSLGSNRLGSRQAGHRNTVGGAGYIVHASSG